MRKTPLPFIILAAFGMVWISATHMLVALVTGTPLCISRYGLLACSGYRNLLPLLLNLGVIALLFLTMWGLWQRKPYGRWLGVIFLGLIVVGNVVASPYLHLIYDAIAQGTPLPTPPYECWQQTPGNVVQESCGYSSYIDLAIRTIFSLMFPAIVPAFVGLQLIKGNAAKQFTHK